MAKTRGVMTSTEQSLEMLEVIKDGLFPRHDPSPWLPFVGQPGTGAGDEKKVIDVELAGIAKSRSVGKAPGPNRVSNLAFKVAISEAPEMFRSAMQKCLDERVFPEVLKRESLVLLTTQIALQHKRRRIRYCAVVSLEVRNAFNSASYPAIANALLRLRIPWYLHKIL